MSLRHHLSFFKYFCAVMFLGVQKINFTDKIRRNIRKKNLLNSLVLKKPTGKEDTLCRRDVQQQAKTFTSRCFLTSRCGRCFKAEFIASIRLDTSSQKGFLLRNLNPKINVKSSLELMVILHVIYWEHKGNDQPCSGGSWQ